MRDFALLSQYGPATSSPSLLYLMVFASCLLIMMHFPHFSSERKISMLSYKLDSIINDSLSRLQSEVSERDDLDFFKSNELKFQNIPEWVTKFLFSSEPKIQLYVARHIIENLLMRYSYRFLFQLLSFVIHEGPKYSSQYMLSYFRKAMCLTICD